jgi:hypothetical protein
MLRGPKSVTQIYASKYRLRISQFCDAQLLKSDVFTTLRRSFAFVGVKTRNGDFSPVI